MKTYELIRKYFPFDEFRNQQYEVIQNIVDSLNEYSNYFILESPTGIGKSCIGYTAAKVIIDNLPKQKRNSTEDGPEILICTNTRQLQTQYVESFKDQKDVSFIWSAKNYLCSLHPELENTDKKVYYNHPLCPKKDCPNFKSCEYLNQKNKFMSAKVGITNYHYFFNLVSLSPNVLICDEAHNIERILCDEASILLSERQLVSFSNNILRNSKKVKKINISKFLNLIKEIVNEDEISIERDILPYAEEFIKHFQPILNKVNQELNQLDSKEEKTKKDTEQLFSLSTLSNSIERAIKKYKKFINSNVDWVISNITKEKTNNKIFIKPLEISEYFDDFISKRIDKGIFMSATICGFEQFAKQLSLDDYNCLETQSFIPVKNRIVYLCKNIGSMNYKNKFTILPKYIEIIDRILKYQYKKTKKIHGIIHSVSYDNANYIKKNSSFSDNMIVPNRQDLMELNSTITKSQESKIIVSPSILEGIDLIDDLSRFQIFIKVPFSFLGDQWVKTKMNQNRKWYSREAIIKIVQGSGRSIRSEEDWAETFILDSNFGRLLNEDVELFPIWYKDSIKSVNV